MKRFLFIIATALMISTFSCGSGEQKEKDAMVLISTDYGEIKVKLYDETPQHKANFIKLVNEGFYNGLLFHRVIKNFMIQGGDPNSKNAERGVILGGGSLGYTIPAEIVPGLFHKRGALAAARRGGPSNPEKRSSASQFYIVQGEVYRPGELDTLEITLNKRRRDKIISDHLKAANSEFLKFKANNDRKGFELRIAQIREEADSIYNAGKPFKLSGKQREIYTTIGGYPSLDGEYTVFGEVVEGLDVLDKIAAVKTDKNNRPTKDVRMKMKLIK